MLLDDLHLARARKAGHPILTPGDLAYWNLDDNLVKVVVLGGGCYEAATATHEGVTIQVNAARTTIPGRPMIKRGKIRVVPAETVIPREVVEPHPEHGYTFTHRSWGFDLTCPVHAKTHTQPSEVCRFTRTDIALIDEVTDASERGRIICHAAAREIAAWYNDGRPGDRSAASIFVRTGELPAGDIDDAWVQLGGVNLDLEKAEWRRAGLRALREYVRLADRPRGPVSIDRHARAWPRLDLWELDRDRRYKISAEQYYEPGNERQTRWVVQFCGERLGTAPGPQAARHLAVRHHSGLMHGTASQA